MTVKSGASSSSAPRGLGEGLSGEVFEVQSALRKRPPLTIRLRIIVVFSAMFTLVAGITLAAFVFVVGVRNKLAFLEKIDNYAFQIQQARRFEKNYILYRTNLSDAVACVRTARSMLDRNAEQLREVVGAHELARMHDSLTAYEAPLEQLLRPSAQSGEVPRGELSAQIEADLRTYGAQIIADSAEMIDRERIAIHEMLFTSLVTSISFLIIMSLVLVFVARFITGSVLRPLRRFTTYATRVGEGDYSPIRPTRKYRDEFCDLALAFNQMLCELKVRMEQLIQSAKMAAVGSLTSGIAHELNNPLNNIALIVETLNDEFDSLTNQEKLRMLEQVYAQVERASLTVRDLLDFTREEAAVRVRVAIKDVIESTLKLIGNELNLNDVELELKVPAGLPEINGNPGKLQQVFLNLFLNANQAMPSGGALTVEAACTNDYIKVDVTDTGCGIQPEQIDRVFEPFFTTKEVGEGTGLGLFVCHSIIERHNGKLSVESEVGKGTTFSVQLPLGGEE